MFRLAVAGLLLALTGCGSSTAGDLPALTQRLEQVDAAAVADDRKALEAAVRGLLRAVDDAEAAGDLEATRADRIRAAAGALLAAARETPPPEESEPAPEETTTPPPPSDDEDKDDEEEEDDD